MRHPVNTNSQKPATALAVADPASAGRINIWSSWAGP